MSLLSSIYSSKPLQIAKADKIVSRCDERFDEKIQEFVENCRETMSTEEMDAKENEIAQEMLEKYCREAKDYFNREVDLGWRDGAEGIPEVRLRILDRKLTAKKGAMLAAFKKRAEAIALQWLHKCELSVSEKIQDLEQMLPMNPKIIRALANEIPFKIEELVLSVYLGGLEELCSITGVPLINHIQEKKLELCLKNDRELLNVYDKHTVLLKDWEQEAIATFPISKMALSSLRQKNGSKMELSINSDYRDGFDNFNALFVTKDNANSTDQAINIVDPIISSCSIAKLTPIKVLLEQSDSRLTRENQEAFDRLIQQMIDHLQLETDKLRKTLPLELEALRDRWRHLKDDFQKFVGQQLDEPGCKITIDLRKELLDFDNETNELSRQLGVRYDDITAENTHRIDERIAALHRSAHNMLKCSLISAFKSAESAKDTLFDPETTSGLSKAQLAELELEYQRLVKRCKDALEAVGGLDS